MPIELFMILLRLLIAFAVWVRFAWAARGLRIFRPFPVPLSRSRLQHQVERCLGGAAEATEAGIAHDLAQSGLARLRTKREPDLLGERIGRADGGGGGVVQSPDRVEVVLHVISGKWLDEQHRAVLGQRLASMFRCAQGIAHVVQTVHEADQVVVVSRIVLRRGHLKFHPAIETRLLGPGSRGIDRPGVIIQTDEGRVRIGRAMTMVEAPWPQPTSATLPPDFSFASTPSSAGIQTVVRLALYPPPKERLGAEEEPVMLVPADAIARAEGVDHLFLVQPQARHDLNRRWIERRALLFFPNTMACSSGSS